jgi:hypothetical protein
VLLLRDHRQSAHNGVVAAVVDPGGVIEAGASGPPTLLLVALQRMLVLKISCPCATISGVTPAGNCTLLGGGEAGSAAGAAAVSAAVWLPVSSPPAHAPSTRKAPSSAPHWIFRIRNIPP